MIYQNNCSTSVANIINNNIFRKETKSLYDMNYCSIVRGNLYFVSYIMIDNYNVVYLCVTIWTFVYVIIIVIKNFCYNNYFQFSLSYKFCLKILIQLYIIDGKLYLVRLWGGYIYIYIYIYNIYIHGKNRIVGIMCLLVQLQGCTVIQDVMTAW